MIRLESNTPGWTRRSQIAIRHRDHAVPIGRVDLKASTWKGDCRQAISRYLLLDEDLFLVSYEAAVVEGL